MYSKYSFIWSIEKRWLKIIIHSTIWKQRFYVTQDWEVETDVMPSYATNFCGYHGNYPGISRDEHLQERSRETPNGGQLHERMRLRRGVTATFLLDAKSQHGFRRWILRTRLTSLLFLAVLFFWNRLETWLCRDHVMNGINTQSFFLRFIAWPHNYYPVRTCIISKLAPLRDARERVGAPTWRLWKNFAHSLCLSCVQEPQDTIL